MVKLLYVILLNCFLHGSYGVRFRIFSVPTEVQYGDEVPLKCQVDTWPSPLYSLSWWKDGSQFYRVAVTKNYRKGEVIGHPLSSVNLNFAKLFPVDGINVKVGRRLGEVFLQNVEATASGTYTCEAVTDFPTFSQNILAANVTVVEPPATQPIISGFKSRYIPGEFLTPNCTVLRTYPAPSITWFVNDEELKGNILDIRFHADRTLTLVDRLKLKVRQDHFQDGFFNLTCVALIGSSLWSSTSIVAQRAHSTRLLKELNFIQRSSKQEKNEEGNRGVEKEEIFNSVDEKSKSYHLTSSAGLPANPCGDALLIFLATIGMSDFHP